MSDLLLKSILVEVKMYIKRHGAQTLLELKNHFGAVLVSGPRQVGKTTLIEETIVKPGQGKITQISLDDPLIHELARDEGGRFFMDYKPPVFVDEIQYAPNLFPYIKIISDREKKPGLFYLSGSQQFSLMKGVSESLAGRIGIIDLLGLSLREIENDPFCEPFCPKDDYFDVRKKKLLQLNYDRLWDIIWRGTMPRLYGDPAFPHSAFYSAYLRTYLERDVRAIVNVGDEKKFLSFIRNTAARTADTNRAADINRTPARGTIRRNTVRGARYIHGTAAQNLDGRYENISIYDGPGNDTYIIDEYGRDAYHINDVNSIEKINTIKHDAVKKTHRV